MTRKDGTPRSQPTTLGLDPLPYAYAYGEGRMTVEDAQWSSRTSVFYPRPGYSQNPADYGVHDDRWKEQS